MNSIFKKTMNSSIFIQFPIQISLEKNREEVLTLLKAFCFKEGDNHFWIDDKRDMPNNRAIKPNTKSVRISIVNNYYRLEELSYVPAENVYTWDQEFQTLLVKNIHIQSVVDGIGANLWSLIPNRTDYKLKLTKDQEFAFELEAIEDMKKMDFSDASLRQLENVFYFIRRIQTQFWDECSQYYGKGGRDWIGFGPRVKEFLFWFYFNYKNKLTEEHKIILYSFKQFLTEEIKSGLIKIETPDFCYIDFEDKNTNQEKEFLEILKHLPYGEIKKGGTSVNCYKINNTLIKKGYSSYPAIGSASKKEKNPDYPSFKYEDWKKLFLAEHFPNKVPEFDFTPVLFRKVEELPYGIKKKPFNSDIIDLYEKKFEKKHYKKLVTNDNPNCLDILSKFDKMWIYDARTFNKNQDVIDTVRFDLFSDGSRLMEVSYYNNNKFYVRPSLNWNIIYECDGTIESLNQCLEEINIYTLI